jgi:hypothetical protein
MSRCLPEDFFNQLETRIALAARRRVARTFVPGYSSGSAIRVSPATPRRALARRQLARLIGPRRTVS